MCFSAAASFAVGSVLSIIGVMAVRQACGAQAIFIAFIPWLFALQQLAEGFLWIALEKGYPPWALFWLPNLYGIFIGVIWPVYAPFAVYRVETDPHAKKVIASMLLAGIGLAGYTIIGFTDYLASLIFGVLNCKKYRHLGAIEAPRGTGKGVRKRGQVTSRSHAPAWERGE